MAGIPYDLIVLKPREGNSPGDTVFVRRQRPVIHSSESNTGA